MKLRKPCIALLALGTLAGCYESPDVTIHEPHEYKGASDPLRERQRTDEQRQALRERLAATQRDR